MNILRAIKRFWWVALLAAGAQPAWGFALLGPFPASATAPDGYQQPAIGYQQNTFTYAIGAYPGGPVSLGDIGFPKNIGEGYRRNTPFIYYTYDANFLGYFGSNGAAVVDSAFATMNKAFTTNPVTGQFLTNGVDSLSAGISEYPPESLHINYEAQTLYLTDLKSVTLHCLVEQLGLATPERFTWTLEGRVVITFIPPVPCPRNIAYLVIQRNYGITPSDLDQLQYSSYVNDVLYTYEIAEGCTGTPLAETIPFNVDPLANIYTSVAADNVDPETGAGLGIGAYYAGLTRDDMAGLRYLYTSNNINWETAAYIAQNGTINPQSVSSATGNSGAGAATLLVTNPQPVIVITSSNLNTLLTFAQANPPAAIPGVFPGVVVAGSTSYFTVVCTTNVIATIPNPNQYGAPYPPGGFGTLVPVTAVNCGYQQMYSTTFANVITNGNLTNNPNITLASTNIMLNYFTNTVVTTLTTSLTPNTGSGQPYPPVNAVTNANVTTSTTTVNVPSGEYLVLPAGACGFNILGEITNAPVITTNFVSTATNGNGFVDTISTVTSFTPHQFLVQPINCTETPFSTGLYEGIQRVQFVRANFDSLLGRFFQPFTNSYTMTIITNGTATVQKFQRVVSAPDILLTAQNEATGVSDLTVTRTMTFDMDNAGTGLAGPGTINPRSTLIYNKVGDAFQNGYEIFNVLNTNADVQEASQMPVLQWASFDASTNDPVLYPNGTSIANLQSQVLVQVSPPPPALPDGTNGMVYPAQTFTATGGAFTPPYTWGLAPGSQPLPSGLSWMSSVPGGPTDTISGTPAGNPTGPAGAPFDFTVQLTDSLGRSVNWNYTITIH